MDLAHRRGRNAATAVIAGKYCVGARMLANSRRNSSTWAPSRLDDAALPFPHSCTA